MVVALHHLLLLTESFCFSVDVYSRKYNILLSFFAYFFTFSGCFIILLEPNLLRRLYGLCFICFGVYLYLDLIQRIAQ